MTPPSPAPAPPATVSATVPAWFSAALSAPADEGAVAVDGARIRYRAWGERGTPGAVLVHGTAAHARWWDHVGPQLPPGLRVAALDLSGHGDSGWRARYSLERWAQEAMAVAADAGVSGPPFVVGHSLGGTIAIRAAAIYGADLSGIVVIDSPLYETRPRRRDMAVALGAERTYPSREAAIARFRLIPEHPVLPYVREHVAMWSVARRDNGDWGWKFDRRLFVNMEPIWPLRGSADCPVAILRAQHGMMTQEMADRLGERFGQVASVVEIPAAGHHVMLDEPLSLVTALRTLLSAWPRTPGEVVGRREVGAADLADGGLAGQFGRRGQVGSAGRAAGCGGGQGADGTAQRGGLGQGQTVDQAGDQPGVEAVSRAGGVNGNDQRQADLVPHRPVAAQRAALAAFDHQRGPQRGKGRGGVVQAGGAAQP